MADLALIWLSTAGTVLATVIVFVILVHWSAGEGSWSIVPGLARGVAAWTRRRPELDPMRFLSPRAQEPGPMIDVDALPLAPLEIVRREPEAWIEELAEPALRTQAEIDDARPNRPIARGS